MDVAYLNSFKMGQLVWQPIPIGEQFKLPTYTIHGRTLLNVLRDKEENVLNFVLIIDSWPGPEQKVFVHPMHPNTPVFKTWEEARDWINEKLSLQILELQMRFGRQRAVLVANQERWTEAAPGTRSLDPTEFSN